MTRYDVAQVVVASCLVGVFAPSVLADDIGPWTVTPPDSATLVSGGGGSFGWLNVVNVGVSINDAFTGSPILDDGFANADLGTTIEVTFASGVANSAGADFVLFDAAFDNGEYVVSSDYDGFVATVGVGFTLTGEARSYYYEHNPDGPFPADIWGGEVDLSDIGVPSGTKVTRIRFTTTNTGGDPIGCGSIGNCLEMSVSNFVAGEKAEWDVSGATAGEQVAIVYGFAPGSTVVNGFAGYCATFGIKGVNQNKVICTKAADGAGNVMCTKSIPAGAKGLEVLMQAAERNTCPDECMSSVLTETVQ